MLTALGYPELPGTMTTLINRLYYDGPSKSAVVEAIYSFAEEVFFAVSPELRQLVAKTVLELVKFKSLNSTTTRTLEPGKVRY